MIDTGRVFTSLTGLALLSAAGVGVGDGAASGVVLVSAGASLTFSLREIRFEPSVEAKSVGRPWP